uniref:Uncharacterized protein n=1 Tax=Megaviridae environmental sample TaxID=1737588 RepID=A0A5J6VN03_9VIRU|nr:MAG: hypothetical protein [Megaviridae environmental sample]
MSKIIKIENGPETMNMSINKTIKYTINELISKYNLLLLEYNKNFSKISNTTFNTYNYFIGISTITTIFHMTLIKTRNLNLTIFHTQKAIYYFIEFIEQIFDVNNQFLKLSTKEAIFFVYKKTIFELTSPPNILSTNSVIKLNILKHITNIYSLLISHTIDNLTSFSEINDIIEKIIDTFTIKKRIKYKVFNENLNTLYYLLSDYINEHTFVETIQFIKNFIIEHEITNKPIKHDIVHV